jgi:hypothetical protein
MGTIAELDCLVTGVILTLDCLVIVVDAFDETAETTDDVGESKLPVVAASKEWYLVSDGIGPKVSLAIGAASDRRPLPFWYTIERDLE